MGRGGDAGEVVGRPLTDTPDSSARRTPNRCPSSRHLSTPAATPATISRPARFESGGRLFGPLEQPGTAGVGHREGVRDVEGTGGAARFPCHIGMPRE